MSEPLPTERPDGRSRGGPPALPPGPAPQSMYRVEPASSSGKLLFKGGAAKLTLATSKDLEGLAEGVFEGAKRPTLTERDGTVEVKWPKVWPWEWSRAKGEIKLREDVPWTLELRSGASQLRAELGRAELRAIDLLGGASDVHLELGRPAGICAVRVVGGVSDFTLRRPAGVGVRVRIKGGASDLVLDTFRFESVGGLVRWESHGFAEAESSYDLEITGGASTIRVAIA